MPQEVPGEFTVVGIGEVPVCLDRSYVMASHMLLEMYGAADFVASNLSGEVAERWRQQQPGWQIFGAYAQKARGIERTDVYLTAVGVTRGAQIGLRTRVGRRMRGNSFHFLVYDDIPAQLAWRANTVATITSLDQQSNR